MRYCFITGVSRGLGRALAKSLDDENCHLIGFGRSRGDFEGEFHTCDFTKPQLAASIFKSALQKVDLESASEIIFISNAGVLGPLNLVHRLDPFDIEKNISANLCGAAIAASLFLQRVSELDAKKVFLQITSGAALPERAKGSWSLYCASKAGQEQLVRSIALEQVRARHPTTLALVNPGVMETAMQEEIRASSPEAFPEVATFIKLKDEGLVATPENIADQIRAMLADIPSIENGKTYTLAAY